MEYERAMKKKNLRKIISFITRGFKNYDSRVSWGFAITN